MTLNYNNFDERLVHLKKTFKNYQIMNNSLLLFNILSAKQIYILIFKNININKF